MQYINYVITIELKIYFHIRLFLVLYVAVSTLLLSIGEMYSNFLFREI